MTSRLNGRVVKLERGAAPVDLERWRTAPVEIRPDWALMSQILDRPVSPEEAAELEEDEGFWAEIEALNALSPIPRAGRQQ